MGSRPRPAPARPRDPCLRALFPGAPDARRRGCGRPTRGPKTPNCGSGHRCASLVDAAGDWRSGSALRSHRRGHWFEPSIAHPIGSCPGVSSPPSFLYARSAYPFLHTLSPPRGPLRAHPCVRAPRSARIPSLPAGRPFLWACPHRPDVTTSRRPCVLRAPFQPCLRRAPRETTPNRRHAPGHGASDARLLAPGHRRPATGTRLPEPVDPLVTCPSLGVSIWQDWAHHRFVTFV